MFEIDENDPIPNVDLIDINKVKHGGGSDLYLVIATPISGERRSLERLLRKLENYLVFIQSDQFKSESGVPTTANTRVVVKLHPDSDPRAFELIERNRPWVENNDATLVVDTNLLAL
ncbi:hypothetical protein [Paucibacter sp. M5-1]|uniref:hypothetical protein n=1 Tax=Paucibacter sp. M5-1 TaxID=3015998 RepID=UPI0022B91628|nr:hypothetical protein [Paucibacter sp. M5-1]MCZ7882272.1 hypothetical protein [Paucibacter sp. M5-1]